MIFDFTVFQKEKYFEEAQIMEVGIIDDHLTKYKK